MMLELWVRGQVAVTDRYERGKEWTANRLQQMRDTELGVNAETGIAIVEMLLILIVLVAIVFGVMKLLGGAVKTTGNNTANCITNPGSSGCSTGAAGY